QLKQLVPRESTLTLAQLTARFEARRIQNAKQAEQIRLQSAMRREQCTQTKRQQLLEHSKQLRVAQSDLMARLEANIIKVPKKSTLLPTKAEFKKGSKLISKEGEQALQEIREFELRLRASSDAADWCRKPKTTTDLISQLRLLRACPPTREQQANSVKIHLPPAESEAYMARIKERVLEENRAMVEQEKRRRRIIVASLEEHHAYEEQRRTRQLAERLLRQSQLERRLLVQLEQTKHEKSVLVANRIERQKEYESRRELEFQAAMDYEREIALQRKQEEAATVAILREVWANQQARKRQASYTRHYEFVANEVVGLLLQFVLQVADYRMLTGRLIPVKLFRQWKAQWVAGVPFWTEEPVAQDSECIQQIVTDEKKGNEQLNECDFMDYQNLQGEWSLDSIGTVQAQSLPNAPIRTVYGKPVEWMQPGNLEIKNADCVFTYFDPERPEVNPILDWAVVRLHNQVYPPPPLLLKPNLPELPIRAALLGKPLSGKSTVLAQILKNHCVVVINPQTLIQEAINAFQNNEIDECSKTLTKNEDDGVESSVVIKLSRRAQLGAAIEEQLRTGRELSDEILVQLVFEEIKSLPDGRNFILEGFPANSIQAKLLHRRLTVVEESEQSAHLSDPSMPTSAQATVHGLGQSGYVNEEQSRGLDIVIFLNMPEDEVFRRAARIETAASAVSETNIAPQENDVVPLADLGVVQQDSEILTLANTQSEQPCKNTSCLNNLHERLEGFLTSWPGLTSFYADELHILHEVNVSSSSTQEEDQTRNIDQVYHEVECLIQQVLKMRETGGEILEQVNESREDDSRIPEVETNDLTLDSAESVHPLVPSSQSPASELPRTSQTLNQELDDDEQRSRTDSAKVKRAASARSKSAISSKHSERSPKQQSSNKNSPGPQESSSASREGSKKERQRTDSIGKSRSRPSSNQQSKGRKNAKQPSVPVTEEIAELQPVVTPCSPRPGEANWIYVDAPIEQVRVEIYLHMSH
ncbi:hypothetical protein PHET_07714, partial [Paragonimus heterotremus]